MRQSALTHRRLIGVTTAAVVLLGSLFVLQPSAVGRNSLLSGLVVDDVTGQPMAGVVFTRAPANGPETSAITATSSSGGSFSVDTPESSLDVLIARKPSFATYRISLTRLREQLDAFPVLRMKREAVLAGRVVDCLSGVPLPATIRVNSRTEHNIVSHGARTADGSFEVRDVLPGTVSAVFGSPGYAPLAVAVEVSQGERRELVGPCMEREARIQGRVVDESGRPIAGARLGVEYQESMVDAGAAEELITGLRSSDANGVFAVGGIVPRVPFVLQANGTDIAGGPFVVEAGEVGDAGILAASGAALAGQP